MGKIFGDYDDAAMLSSLVFLAFALIFWFASKPLVEWSARHAQARHKKKQKEKRHKHHHHGDKKEILAEHDRTPGTESTDLLFLGVVPLEDLTAEAARTLPQPVRWILACAAFNGSIMCLSSQWEAGSPEHQVAEVLSILLVCVIIKKCNEASKCFVGVLKIYWLAKADQTAGKIDDMIVPLIVQLLRRFLDVIFLAFGLENVGVDATTLIASVSVTGVALAFAAKDYVTGLFGLLVIFTSHPFEVGDQIEVDGVRGVVREVSLRYTTIVGRYTGEHELVPNSHFLTGGLTNISRRESIRMSLRWAIAPEDDSDPQDDKKRIPVIRRIQLLREELLGALDTDPEFVHGLSEVRVQMPDCRAAKAFSEIPRGLEIRLHGSFTADPSDWGRFCAREADYVLLAATLMAKHKLRFAGPKTHYCLPDAPDNALPHCTVRHDLELTDSVSSPTAGTKTPSLPSKSPGVPLSSPGVSRRIPNQNLIHSDSLESSISNSPEVVLTASPQMESPALDNSPAALDRFGFNLNDLGRENNSMVDGATPCPSSTRPQEQPTETQDDSQELISMLTSVREQVRSLGNRVFKLEQQRANGNNGASSVTAVNSRPALLLCAGPDSSRDG